MSDEWLSEVRSALEESARVKSELGNLAEPIIRVCGMMVDCIKSGNKVMFCGNGGSAADSQHLACELVEKYSMKRKALPAIALSTDTSILTAVPNDESFEEVFARQIEALGRPGDLLLALSTSGSSPNILRALKQAKTMGIRTVGLTGEGGDGMAEDSDILIKVPSNTVARIQECHITLGHIIVEVVESVFS
jgi:D-sedoheptulose 7-phosphate isomerase